MNINKIVTPREAEFFEIASKAGLTPVLLSKKQDKRGVALTYRTPTLLCHPDDDFKVFKENEEAIKTSIEKLHQLGIYHGNISSDTVIISPTIQFIDFSRGRFISEINEDVLKELAITVDHEGSSLTTEELLKSEFTNLLHEYYL